MKIHETDEEKMVQWLTGSGKEDVEASREVSTALYLSTSVTPGSTWKIRTGQYVLGEPALPHLLFQNHKPVIKLHPKRTHSRKDGDLMSRDNMTSGNTCVYFFLCQDSF